MPVHWQEIFKKLESGEIRSATKENGKWVPNIEVKESILEAFSEGELSLMEACYIDKHNLTPRVFEAADEVRIVPFGSTVRRGTYVSRGVIIMPPSYINIGAFVDKGTLVDSHVLIGSCAQVGKNVHLAAGVKLGGVLEPVGLSPVVIEDNCFVGAGSIIVEGVHVYKNSVIAPGVVLSRSVPVYDAVHQRLLKKGEPIPENSVVIPGSRNLKNENDFTRAHGLKLSCAIIIKYRDEKSDASLVLEEALR